MANEGASGEKQDKGISSFFAKKPGPEPSKGITDFSEKLGGITTRLRVLEERFSSTRTKIQLIEQNMLGQHKKDSQETQTVIKDITDLRKDIEDIKSKIVLVIKELKLSAKKEDVQILSRYLNLWEPVNFVTQSEVEKIVERAVERKLVMLQERKV